MPALEPEQRFQKYKIIEKLGSSLAGDSYVAEDIVIKRKVTLKLIQPGKTLPESARRQFFREMQGISTINHPSLTPLFDYGESEGQLYIARRYITAGSLLGDDGRTYFRPLLPVTSAFSYTHQLAQGLQALHQQGYVHGSLTLSNILILRNINHEHTDDFAPFLLSDMNVTHFVRRFGQLSNQILPITSAPEQFAKRVIPASDQFALAVILYFWLTGRFPYLGTPGEIEQQKLGAKIPPMFNLNAKVSVKQEGIIRRALSVYPEERYPTILAFSTALINTLPARQPAPIQAPVQSVQTTPEPAPATLTGPELSTQPEPQPAPEPAPTPAPEPFPTPDPTPQPEPSPAPEPEPQPVPPPLPMPEPEPTPVPSPDPHIRPEKDPTSPEKRPETEPAPFPRPEPNPVPFPDPEIVPQPAPEINPSPITMPPPETPFNPQAIEEAVSAPPEHQAVEVPATETQPEEANISSASTAYPRLLITSPYAENPYFVTLEKELLTLGRAGASDIFLDKDPLTSRHHALLRREESGYVLLDRQSSTGIQVNGRQLGPDEAYPLADDDQIAIGSYKLTFYTANQSRSEADKTLVTNDVAHSR